MNSIKVINGPNLNLLGKREPILYGAEDFKDVFKSLINAYPKVELSYVQSNSEGEIVDELQRCIAEGIEGVVLNPAAYSHTSVAIADAVAALDIPVVEVHISNILAREAFRQKSLVSKFASGVITGFGTEGYRLAVDFLFRS